MLRGMMILGVFLCLVGSADTATIYVPDDFPTIQGAINAAANGDTIIVRPGTYVENIDFIGKAITMKSEIGAAATTIDGGNPSNPDFGSVVTFQNGENENSIIAGFTITNGTGTDIIWGIYGGGIYCELSSPTITNNTITGNSAGWGGGISCTYSSSPAITNNTISDNIAGGFGGGGIYCLDSSPRIMNNTITGNSADRGGGIHCDNSSFPVITNNTITESTADTGGGGIYCLGASPTITNNIITGNWTGYYGGGIYCWKSSPIITNTILLDNVAPAGPEIWVGDSSYPSTLTISYSDVDGGQASCYVDPGSTLNWGAGMIDADPLFVDPANNDYHLTYDSPCKDTGNNSAVTYPFDFEGDPRIAYGTVDMGADEFHPHLYYGRSVVPGGTIRIRIIGVPGTSPIWLGQGTGVLDPPMFTQYGKLYLEQPFVDVWSLGSIPSNGVRTTYSQTVPVTWLSGEQYPFQALLGPQAPGSVLTNLMVLTVE